MCLSRLSCLTHMPIKSFNLRTYIISHVGESSTKLVNETMYTTDWLQMWVDPSSHDAQSLKRPVAPRPVIHLLPTSLQASSSLNFIKASSFFDEYDRRLLSKDLQSDNACSSRTHTKVKLVGFSSLNLRATHVAMHACPDFVDMS
jgi:hypothetical protein